jgi:hypothetical protein
VKNPITPMALVAVALAMVVSTAPAAAQAATECPAAEAGTTPLELRIGEFLLRAQLSTRSGAAGEGSRIEGRLVQCEEERLLGDPVDADDAAAAVSTLSVLRILHDLRVAFEVQPEEDGCIRASFDVAEGKTGRPAGAADRPVSLQLCGLPATVVR